jgi:hypothetical protein
VLPGAWFKNGYQHRVAGVGERRSTPPGPRRAPRARWLRQLDPSHPQFVARHGLPLNQALPG